MPTHMQGSWLSGHIGGISYRGILAAQLADETFVVSVLGGTLASVPLTHIQEVRLGQMPSDYGIKVYYTDNGRSKVVHLRVLNGSSWMEAFRALGVPVSETPPRAFDMRYFLTEALFILIGGCLLFVVVSALHR